MARIITPVSHLFRDPQVAEEIFKASDNLEGRDHAVSFRESEQEVFHCELQPIHPLQDSDIDYLKKILEVKPNLKLISFHVASCFDKPEIVEHVFIEGGTCYSRDQMLRTAKENFEKIKTVLGPQIRIAVENNNYYPTSAYETIADPDFITDLVMDNDIYFLFDMAHARVSAHNKSMSYEDYRNGLPLSRAIQLHICKHSVRENSGQAYDAHFPPGEEEFAEILELTGKYPIEYLTVEYYKDPATLINILNRLRILS